MGLRLSETGRELCPRAKGGSVPRPEPTLPSPTLCSHLLPVWLGLPGSLLPSALQQQGADINTGHTWARRGNRNVRAETTDPPQSPSALMPACHRTATSFPTLSHGPQSWPSASLPPTSHLGASGVGSPPPRVSRQPASSSRVRVSGSTRDQPQPPVPAFPFHLPHLAAPSSSREQGWGQQRICQRLRGWWVPLHRFPPHDPHRGPGEVLGAHPPRRPD